MGLRVPNAGHSILSTPFTIRALSSGILTTATVPPVSSHPMTAPSRCSSLWLPHLLRAEKKPAKRNPPKSRSTTSPPWPRKARVEPMNRTEFLLLFRAGRPQRGRNSQGQPHPAFSSTNLGHNLWACFDTDLLRIACILGQEGKPPSRRALAPGSYHVARTKRRTARMIFRTVGKSVVREAFIRDGRW